MSDSALQLPNDVNCAFCAYLRGDRPYTILSRTSDTATLVTREQRGNPHLLVIPLRHIPSILDMTDAEAATVAVAVREAARTIERAFAARGIAVWQNNGIPAGQAIGHLHFHVAGTLANGGTERGPVTEISINETNAIAARLLGVE